MIQSWTCKLKRGHEASLVVLRKIDGESEEQKAARKSKVEKLTEELEKRLVAMNQILPCWTKDYSGCEGREVTRIQRERLIERGDLERSSVVINNQ